MARKTKMTAEQREARRLKQQEYNRNYQEKKRAEKAAGGGATNFAKYKTKSAQMKAAWRTRRSAELAAVMPTVQMETTVDVPSDIEPGIMAAGQVNPENGAVRELLALPTGATLLAEVMASFRRIAIVVKESGAETGTFTWADGTVITVRGDGSVTTS